MLQTFLNSDQIDITISANNNLGPGVYGQAYGDGDGTNYHIELHTDILASCSQEFIAMIFYHEAIHVYLKEHQDTWNTATSSEHEEMLAAYYDQLSSAITEAYPSMPLKDAYSIILSCITNDNEDTSYSDGMITSFKAGLINIMMTRFPDVTGVADVTAIASQYSETGIKGTRSAGCRTITQ